MHEIKIFTPNGTLKKVISVKKANKLLWQNYEGDFLAGCVTKYKRLKKCKGCPKEFTPDARQQKFCKVICQRKFYRKIQKMKKGKND